MTAVAERPAAEAAAQVADKQRLKAGTIGWLLPAWALVTGLFLVPIGYAIYLGFTNLELLGPTAQHYNFTGLANLDRMVHDPVFWSSVKITLIFVVLSGIIAQTVLGLALALLGQRAHVTVRASVGSVVVLAWVLPEICVAFIWYAFSQSGGVLSTATGHPNDDLLSTVPLLIVCVANTWRGTAFSMLVLSAGLRNVPQEADEAAQLEGASYWKRLIRVTLPIMRPTLMINMLLITLGTISDFTLIFAMTQGGPGNQTAILPVYMYIEAFQFNALGYGTTIALGLMVIGAVLSIFYIRQLRPELRRASN
ncbi:MAG TPA: sugar ABC transporter permease [Streptosporangiaceae bacterium]|nr:sugar ABC transporter permease [Streptosporangiaceae bacterium]